MVLHTPESTVAGIPQHGQAGFQRVDHDLHRDVGVHGIRRDYGIPGVAAEMQQHAKSRVIDRFADAFHRLRLYFRAPMVFGPDLEAKVMRTGGIFAVAADDKVKLLVG